jgi:hypothetical protein
MSIVTLITGLLCLNPVPYLCGWISYPSFIAFMDKQYAELDLQHLAG